MILISNHFCIRWFWSWFEITLQVILPITAHVRHSVNVAVPCRQDPSQRSPLCQAVLSIGWSEMSSDPEQVVWEWREEVHCCHVDTPGTERTSTQYTHSAVFLRHLYKVTKRRFFMYMASTDTDCNRKPLNLGCRAEYNAWSWSKFNSPPDVIKVILKSVFTANHLTDTDKQNSTGKYTN